MNIETDRSILRPWTERDREPFAEMSADPAVMEHLLPINTRKAADAWIDCRKAHLAEHGFSFWALEAKASGIFLGAVGLLRISYEAHFSPAIEVGWRIARPFWGQGYAPEAAAASVRFGFEALGLSEVVANTVPQNTSSRRVMEKLGMSHNAADDFDHPGIPEGHPLRHQVLYRLTRDSWTASAVNWLVAHGYFPHSP